MFSCDILKHMSSLKTHLTSLYSIFSASFGRVVVVVILLDVGCFLQTAPSGSFQLDCIGRSLLVIRSMNNR